MGKTGVITQPNYLPWIGYFEQILKSDIFVFLDNVQYPRREWCNRNRVLNNGREVFLTVPLVKTARDVKINDVEISYEQDWVANHISTIKYSYASSKYFKKVFPLIQKVLGKKHKKLADLNIEFIKVISGYLGIKTVYKRASENKFTTKKTQLLRDICKKYGIVNYYSSAGAKVYLEKEKSYLADENIKLQYQNYEPQKYPQLRAEKFVPYMSIIDLLFNVSKKEALDVIKKGAKA